MQSERFRIVDSTVVFLFTDIQGSTTRWERHRDAMAAAVRRHDEIMSAAMTAYHGRIFKTMGDQFCLALSTVSNAIAAAAQAQRIRERRIAR